MIISIILLLILLLLVSVYGNINMLRNIGLLEKLIEAQADELVRIRAIVIDMRNELKAIDKRGSFESDDEVGFFFKQLKTIIRRLNNFFENNYDQYNATEEE